LLNFYDLLDFVVGELLHLFLRELEVCDGFLAKRLVELLAFLLQFFCVFLRLRFKSSLRLGVMCVQFRLS
jgi:hypothetical protein